MGFWEPLFFWIFALGAVASSVAVVALRNPLYSALALILDFFFFAGIYALLSAHMMAITQVLVYAGAIMVLFLFIIMLLNLRDEELGGFEFRMHHLLSGGAIVGLFFFMVTAITPLVDGEQVRQGREQAVAQQAEAEKAYDAAVAEAEKIEDEAARQAKLSELEAGRPAGEIATRTAVKGPLYGDLNEAGLERAWRERITAYESGRSKPSQGKWRRFDETRPVVLPPSMTGKELVNERGTIRASTPAGFGTIEAMSVLIINRFVIPYELTALLLLAAIIGAVIIAKRRL